MAIPGSKLAIMAVVLALGLALAPAASAKLPPSGKYGCTISGVGFLGNLKIKGERYRIDDSKWGKMVDKGKRKIKFKSGAWKGLFRGRWEKVDSVLDPGKKIIEIELTEIESGFESSYCTKES